MATDDERMAAAIAASLSEGAPTSMEADDDMIAAAIAASLREEAEAQERQATIGFLEAEAEEQEVQAIRESLLLAEDISDPNSPGAHTAIAAVNSLALADDGFMAAESFVPSQVPAASAPPLGVPLAPSRQSSTSSGTFPAFTAVPPMVVRGMRSEEDIGSELRSSWDVFPPPLRHSISEDERLAARLQEEADAEGAAREAAERGPTFECPICLTDDVIELAGHRLGCGHIFCIECLGEHVKVKIADKSVSHDVLTCPNCVAPIGVDDVHALTWRCGDDETWSKFEAAADDELIETLVRAGGARRCPSQRCNYVFVWAEGDPRHFACPSCEESFCLACPCLGGGVGPAHPGLSCEEQQAKLEADAEAKRKVEAWRAENAQADDRFKQLLQSEMRAGNTKPCPRCKQAITKNGGCHQHVCSTCKVKFCWNCGGYNALLPSKATCRSSCANRKKTWWNERDLFGSSSTDSSGGAGSSLSDAFHGLLSRFGGGGRAA